jgi:hypothetical protein
VAGNILTDLLLERNCMKRVLGRYFARV